MLFSLFSALLQLFHMILGVGTPQKFPPQLSQKEEEEFFKMAALGDENARQKLILHNLRLVSHIVRKYYSTAKSPEDLVSIGSIGLVKAVDSFKAENGAKFGTYASKCIQNEILMYFRSQKKLSAEVSLDDTIDVDRDGNPLTYMDVISSDEDLCEEIDKKMKVDKMMRLLQTQLTPRERRIMMMRYGIGGQEPIPQREVALALGISRSYVSRIEKAALEKLRKGLVH